MGGGIRRAKNPIMGSFHGVLRVVRCNAANVLLLGFGRFDRSLR